MKQMDSPATDKLNEARPLQESGTHSYEVREAVPEDCDAIRVLFSKAFPDEMPEALWHWKYDRPQSRAIVVIHNGDLVAHFGGVGMPMQMAGRRKTAVQITDLMVDPKVRHAVRKKSPFYLSAKTFLDTFAGFDKPFYLVYGFPSERAMILLEKLGLAKTVGHMVEIQWVLDQAGKAGPVGKLIELDKSNFDSHVQAIDKLWGRCVSQFGQYFICQKDADYFRWRFLTHPVKHYSVYLQKDGLFGRPSRLLVLRHDRHKSMLMDMLDPAMNIATAVATASALSRMKGKQSLVTWCSDTFKNRFTVAGATCKKLPLAIPANTCSPGYAWEKQVGKWWLMPGDTDYQ